MAHADTTAVNRPDGHSCFIREINLSFVAERDAVKRLRQYAPWDRRGNLLYFDTLIFPVRFICADVDMFGQSDNVYEPLPLIDLVDRGMFVVMALKQRRCSVYNFPDSASRIAFERVGDCVLVGSTLVNQTVRVEYTPLLFAWQRLRADVGQFLYREFPVLREHPRWGGHMQAWFPGQ